MNAARSERLWADGSTVLRVDDLPVPGKLAVEAQAHRVSLLDGGAIDRLDVKVRFGAVARVAAASDQITGGYTLSEADHDAAVLKMAQCDDDAIAALDEDVVARQRLPPSLCSATLCKRLAD